MATIFFSDIQSDTLNYHTPRHNDSGQLELGWVGQHGQVVGVILLFNWSMSAQGDHGV